MQVFTVTKPGGTKDYEFEAYTRLLEDIGVDVSNVPRVLEPRTNKRWLYTWFRYEEAEGFADELSQRTRDNSWYVHEFETEEESRGPVAPLNIYQVPHPDQQEYMYYLSPASRERVSGARPGQNVPPSITISEQVQCQLTVQHGEGWWMQVCILLTGLDAEAIRALGGFRVILPYGEIGYEELPEVPVQG